MKRVVVACFLAASLTSLGLAAEDPITVRQNLMKSNGASAKAITQMVRGEQPFDALKAEVAMRSIFAVASGFRFYFPDSSKQGGDTKALPKIWDDKAGFLAANEKFQADALAAVPAASQGLEQLRGAFQKVAANCQSCHETYRMPQ